MSNTRSREAVFSLGTEEVCRKILKSKAIHHLFIINFLQRRMNTSYSKKLYTTCLGDTVRVRERWVYVPSLTPYARNQAVQSTIELVMYRRGEEEVVVGRAHYDGSVWVHHNAISGLRWGTRNQINAYMTRNYTVDSSLDEGTFYIPKRTGRVVPIVTPVTHTDTFAAIMQREWSV